jgi:hypothetical protein
MTREPTIIIAAIGGFLSALTKAAVLLKIVDWDVDQLAGISLVIDSFLVLLGALLIRGVVTPTGAPTLANGTQVMTPQGTTSVVSPVPPATLPGTPT